MLLFEQVGSPNLSIHGVLVYMIDFGELRVKRNIIQGAPVPGKRLRNQCNYDLVLHAAGTKDPTPGVNQTAMAPWVATALRKAYPWGSDPTYPAEMPLGVEDAIVAARSARVVTTGELISWCELIRASN
jgi:hypothetical protein